MKRILVFSDSHGGLRLMRQSVDVLRPDAIVHLGDYYDDGETIAVENPNLVVHQVPGNCDMFRVPLHVPAILCYPVCGVKLYMTHGHRHNVKYGTEALIRDGMQNAAQAVLYGHTHQAECYQTETGMWVMNPGACGSNCGSVGLIEAENGEIIGCRVIRQEELRECI